MKTTMRQILTAGVSGIALAALPFVPAVAGTVPGDTITDGDVDYDSDADPGQLTVELSGIADADALGVYAPPAVAAAVVNSIATGQLDIGLSAAGDATLTLTNPGTVSILAEGTATATVSDAIHLWAETTGNGNATVDLASAGTVSIVADAADSGAGARTAVANVSNAVSQTAEVAGEGDASVSFDNTGVVTLSSIATASSTNAAANADAEIDDGIYQSAEAAEGSASVSLSNGVAGTAVDAEASIDLLASAHANGTVAVANADFVSGISQIADASDPENEANVELLNNGAISMAAEAVAGASAGNATASAFMESAIYQTATGENGATPTVTIDNSGTIELGSVAEAVAAGAGSVGSAEAIAEFVVYQSADANNGGDASVAADNSGAFTIAVDAKATGVAGASAEASLTSGIYQYANANEGSAGVLLDNSGDLTLRATANALGDLATADVSAEYLLYQSVTAYDAGNLASTKINNTGAVALTLTANAGSAAAPANSAEASVTGSTLIYQTAEGRDGADASVELTNAGSIDVKANTAANGATSAYADVELDGIVDQNAYAYGGGDAAVVLNNTDAVSVLAGAVATGENATAYAHAHDVVTQYAFADEGSASVSLSNSGTINVLGDAKAVGGTEAYASASVNAIYQSVEGADGSSLTFTNAAAGAIDVGAHAVATGDDASANAYAYGLQQDTDDIGAVFTVDNAGAFKVHATAIADGATEGAAEATASGIYIDANGNGAVLDIANSGTLDVLASAQALDSADAVAYGLYVEAVTDVGGTIDNSGTIKAVAKADATGAGATQIGSAQATAVGIDAGGANSLVLTNSGTIQADAVTDAGGTTTATGIYLSGGTGTDLFVLNNKAGNIIARQSTDLGATYQWGTAIDTDGATTPAELNFEGNGTLYSTIYHPTVALDDAQYGYVYGNVEIKATDTINVAAGETWLDGMVNSDAVPDGSMTIKEGGLLFLLDDRNDLLSPHDYSGPSKVYVDNFTIEGKGRLALHLMGTDPSAIVLNDYPQVIANTVDLDPEGDGNEAILEVRQASQNGLYHDHYRYEDVVIATGGAGALHGQFAGVETQSLLLVADDDYSDNDGTIDLDINRVAFGDVAGLTRNQKSVGDGIENVYLPTLTGPFAGVLADLFTINDAVAYGDALDQLSGVQYAGYLRKLGWMGTRFNGLMNDMSECARGAAVSEICRDEGESGVRVWGKLNYGKTDTDGDVEAGGFNTEQWFGALGVDFSVGQNAILGIAGAYVENDMDFDEFNGRIKSKGWQLGVYGAYDPGPYYLKGGVSYSDMNGKSRRDVNFVNTVGSIKGDPDAKIWAANIEAGYRIPLGANAALTPYAGFDYATVKMGRFDESGLPGANLSVRGKDKFAASELGLELSGQMGKIIPSLRVGWQHAFTNDTADFRASFIDAPAGSDFRIISEDFSADSAIVEVGLTAQLSPNFDAHIGYQGRFSSDVQRHAGGLTLSYLFGGSQPVAAPPPPPPAPPPPPPPPPPQAVCNKGPYIVFFDWDKSDITPEAATILDSAVTAYGNCDVVPIMLAGYTDRSGSTQYNMGLSARRNTSVRGYLTSRGIPDGRITSQAFGEANPRVPTADGVRELQNRRVEITYGPGSGN